MILEPFLTVYLIHRHQKPFETVPFFIELPNHRAEAAMLMRSLRVTMFVVRPEPVRRLVAAESRAVRSLW
jgi:hypothetical protein